jgi:oxygen-independent coproporphyrinogen-3 oxidase
MAALEAPQANPSPIYDNPMPGLPQVTPTQAADLPFEFVMNALRLNQGFPRTWFTERTGLPESAWQQALLQAEQKGWIRQSGGQVIPTTLGQRFLNDLVGLFLP